MRLFGKVETQKACPHPAVGVVAEQKVLQAAGRSGGPRSGLLRMESVAEELSMRDKNSYQTVGATANQNDMDSHLYWALLHLWPVKGQVGL